MTDTHTLFALWVSAWTLIYPARVVISALAEVRS